MKLAVVMDAPHLLKPYKDTTVGMIRSAQQLGWSCVYFTLKELLCREGQAYARVSSIQVADDDTKPDWATITPLGEKPLAEFDVILMRKDPPFDMEYIYATYALELAEKTGVLVANKPQSLRDANEKFFTLHFPQCCPPTLVSRDIAILRQFWEQHRDVIYKPLEGMGGNSIFHVDKHGKNLSVILEVLTHSQSTMIMAQQYIPDIVTGGDKRILLINGEPAAYALARIPAKGELRGNLAAGARGEVVAITARDRWLCEQIAPTLKAKGLYFVGIDVIGDYLTEINVTSPTCAREIMAETSEDITGDYLRCLAEIKQKLN
ncbi:glutathione synthase [Legionella taurinensis]|uniref:Glutathione synthetase n=1 Tax=Legionella taurinensis TaxID=70611 RepID=A0A3A5LB89_9GAMM|nr:glutathione synthase [Legionella taurinensis]MDX1836465.1 glutathione synthase [Legionella taurinensis]PUT43063.1 glutathione synthase [Legionella taurinensis]PUT45119.1 glutathione synthase [Legionella taurinensis]PUT45618.1 glutathione synthase [Legionella taurinensis]PUT49387.1 glutathione synthase [Legionella taurinensis]